MAAAPIVAGIALLLIAGCSDGGVEPVGNALSGVADEEGLVSLDHLQTLWRSRLPKSNLPPPPPPQYAVLRGVLRCGLFSTARVSGSRARVGLSHPRAHEVAALAAMPTRLLLSEGVDIAPLVADSVLSERILTVLAATGTASLWDPRDEAVVPFPPTLRRSALPPLRLAPSPSMPSHLDTMALRIAALASAYTTTIPPTAHVVPHLSNTLSSGGFTVIRCPIPAAVMAAARPPTITITTIPDLVHSIQRLMLRADTNATGSSVSVIAAASVEGAFLPDFLALATADQVLLLDINAMSRDAVARRRTIPGSDIDETPPSAVALFFPLLPLFFDARVTKVIINGSREVGLFASAGVRIVNLFVLRVALEELGLPRARAPPGDAELLGAIGGLAGSAPLANDAASLACRLYDVSRAASAALFSPHDTPTDLQRAQLAPGSPAAGAGATPFTLLPLYRADLRSQLLSLAAPAGLTSGAAVVGLKRGRLAIDAPPRVVPPWYYHCRACNTRGCHFAADCGYV